VGRYLPGDLLRVASVPDQPPWTRALRGQVALVVEAFTQQHNWRYYALALGQIHLFHPLDLERIE
jgi:hypothetical protein